MTRYMGHTISVINVPLKQSTSRGEQHHDDNDETIATIGVRVAGCTLVKILGSQFLRPIP